MLIVRPDFDRRIELPGAGPCPRPVDIDRTKADLARLVSLRVYSFAAGTRIDGEAEEDEVFVVAMRGAARFEVTADGTTQTFALRGDGDRAFYMPPHAAYHLTADTACDIAYARCAPAGPTPVPRAFAAAGGRLDVPDYATGMCLSLNGAAGDDAVERFVHVRADGDGGLRIAARRLSDWDSAILAAGEAGGRIVEGDGADVLTIGARATR